MDSPGFNPLVGGPLQFFGHAPPKSVKLKQGLVSRALRMSPLCRSSERGDGNGSVTERTKEEARAKDEGKCGLRGSVGSFDVSGSGQTPLRGALDKPI